VLAALIIVFREVIEAGLVVGIVLAATRGIRRSRVWIAAGVIAGVGASMIVAAFTSAIASAFQGYGQELFNATILATAVLMLAWHNIWMARHGRELAADMRHAGEAVSTGQKTLAALAIVVGTAVLREGAEVVLFIYGIAIAGGSTALSLFVGGVFGLLAGSLLSALTYLGLIHIPSRYLFSVTSILIAFLAAGMASQCVGFLQQADIVSILQGTAWNTSGVLPESSIAGRVLHALIGYSEEPTILQVVVQVATLLIILVLMKTFSLRRIAPAT
jgi:high-affinity iron transporter